MDKNKQVLDNLVSQLSKFDKEFIDLSSAIIRANNQNMYTMDLLSTAVINRAIQLVNGFNTLADSNNYLCAIPLIRLQLDNALRFFAAYMVQNRDNFFSHFIDGKPISKYKDRNGNLLYDNYLAKELDKLFPGVLKIYQNISGHVHLSEQHLFATKQLSLDKSKPVKIAIGRNADPFSVELKINFASTMLEVSKLVLIVIGQWKLEKENMPISR